MPFTEIPEGHRGILADLVVDTPPLPHWADKHLNGEYELYAQLATKVGERAGNGVIVFEHDEEVSTSLHLNLMPVRHGIS